MGRAIGDGLRTYYKGKIEELELLIKDKGHNLRRLEAQRNELNASGKSPDPADTSKSTPQIRTSIAVRMLKEELQLLQEPGSYVGEVIKVNPQI